MDFCPFPLFLYLCSEMRYRRLILFPLFLWLWVQGMALDITTRQLGLPVDGSVACTKKLQAAIDRISAKGGGRLTFAKGKYLTGTLFLRSHVELFFEEGAVLLGSTNPYDYQSMQTELTDDARNDNASMALLLADRSEKITIHGYGTIDGQGLQLALNVDSLHHTGEQVDSHYNVRRQRPSEMVRPKLLFFYQCKNISIRDMHFKNSANWGLSIDLCEQVFLRNLDIVNRAYWNNDGIDLTDCRHVEVADCHINSADDGICLKSYHVTSPPCSICGDITTAHAIRVHNCDIRSSASAVKFGTASWGSVNDVQVSNIKITDTFRSCIAIESVDGAQIDGILVDRIHATNTGNAIFLRLGQRAGDKKGCLKNVTIRNLSCEVPFGRPDENYDLRGPEVDFFHNPFPSSICGIPGNPIENVVLEDIVISYPGRATRSMAYMPLWRVGDVPEQIEKYPEFSMFGELPSWGFYVRHVDGITFRNIHLSLQDADFRPAFVLDDVKDVMFENVIPQGANNVFLHK